MSSKIPKNDITDSRKETELEMRTAEIEPECHKIMPGFLLDLTSTILFLFTVYSAFFSLFGIVDFVFPSREDTLFVRFSLLIASVAIGFLTVRVLERHWPRRDLHT